MADFLEAHREDLLATLLSEIDFSSPDEAPAFFNDWLDNELDRLRGRSAHTGELAARLVELEREHGASADDSSSALRMIQNMTVTIRNVVVEHCLGQVEGVSDKEIYQIVLEAEDCYVEQIIRLYIEEDHKALAAEHRLERAMAESMGRAFVLLDSRGEVVFVNSFFANLLGIPEPNLIHCEFPFLCDHNTAAEVRRDLRQKRTPGARTFDGVLVTPKGASIPMRFLVLPVFDESGLRSGVAVTMRRPEDEGHGNVMVDRGVIGAVADALDVCVFVLDASYQVVYVNTSARKLLESGSATNDLGQGHCCSEHRDENGQCGTCLAKGVFDTGKVYRATVCHDNFDDGPRCFDIACVPLRDGRGQVALIVKTLRDVTQQKTLEKQVLRQQATSLVAQLAMTVAHQLRNPLGVMIGYAEMLSRGMPSEQVRGAVEKVLRNGLRCKEIVEDLLEFGKGLPGEQVLANLNQVIAEHVQPMYPSSVASRITWKLGENLPEVECVPQQLAQVFVNLIDNALWAAADRVIVETFTQTDLDGWHMAEGRGALPTSAVCMKVWDDGPGVPPNIRRQVFDPFFTTRKEEGGIGLGLSLSRSVIQEHRGRLFLDEGISEGACFVIQLPAAEMGKPAEPLPEAVAAPESQGRRILIVDDEKDLLELLAIALELHGHHIDTATTAARALDLMKGTNYDFAVLDVLLPEDLGGPELYQIMLGTKPELAKRTLFITADTMNFETRRFLEQVKRPCLEKPFLVSSFVRRVDELLQSE